MSKLKYFDGTNWKAVNGQILGDTLPIGTEVDYIGDSVPVGWEQVEDYSTSEVNTGQTWIDGKPIYRKVIEKTYSTDMVIGDNSFNHNISNINQIINYDTIFILGWDSNTYTNDSYLAKNNIGVRINKTQIIIESGQAWKGTFKFIVEYTKTTD